MRPQDGGYQFPVRHKMPQTVMDTTAVILCTELSKAVVEIARLRQYWCATTAKGHAHAEQGRPTNYRMPCVAAVFKYIQLLGWKKDLG